MLEFLRKNKPTQVNKDAPASTNKELGRIRKRIGIQLGLAVLTVLLAVVILLGMTAAWYTNVVQSSGLIFEVERLGVDVDATVHATTFTAQPGDEGIISLEAANKGTDAVNITVSINKSGLDLEMQKRLYFFVEKQTTANEEISQRSYLTGSDSFTYTVFGGNSLTLTEEYHNASQLKWCWVYDVLGYYVLGQAQEDTVEVAEYLRPIEYDYDNATFDADGNLLTVDGTTTTAEFLAALSLTDGYAGQISQENMVGSYYKVAVDENGYGVYAYLCTYAEVEAHTDFDTQLGQDALAGNPATYSARLTVNAEKVEMKTVSVENAEQLLAALESGEAEAIRLTQDITLSEEQQVLLSADSQVLLDLNGQTLTTSYSSYAILMENNSSLTVTNGTLSGADGSYAVRLYGADLILDNVNITGYQTGIAITDYSGSSKMDSTVRMTDCTMDVSGCGIMLFGNGHGSQQDSQLFIENCQLTSDSYVISGNGSVYGDGRWGTDVQVIGSTLTQDVASGTVASAIYHPQYGTMNIQNSVVSGYTGIVVKGGSVTIEDSQVYGVGTTAAEPELMSNGFSDTADAIYVETGYGYAIEITVRNTTAESYYNQAYRVYEENALCVTAELEGNTFQNKTKVTAAE